MQKLVRDLIGPQVRLYRDQLVYKRPGTQDDFPGIKTTAITLFSHSNT